jgi:hypothetical protein
MYTQVDFLFAINYGIYFIILEIVEMSKSVEILIHWINMKK